MLDTVVGQMSERERRMLHWRFAELVGLTQAQVPRILARVLRKLRAGLSEPVPAA